MGDDFWKLPRTKSVFIQLVDVEETLGEIDVEV